MPPLVQLLAYGYVVNFDIKHVATAYSMKAAPWSPGELINRFTSNDWFNVKYYVKSQKELLDLIDHGDITMAVWIQWDFATRLRQGKSGKIQVIVDATDSNAALIVSRYAGTVIADYSQEQLRQRLPAGAGSGRANSGTPLAIEPRAWFNTNLISRYSMVPGVIAMVVLLHQPDAHGPVGGAGKRDRHHGADPGDPHPAHRTDAGQDHSLCPHLPAGGGHGHPGGDPVVRGAVPGQLLVLLLGTVAFLLNSVGLGLLISTISSTQQQAMMAGNLFLTPAILLSGLIFPIANMPVFFQYLTMLNPLMYFVIVAQGVFLKGAGLALLWPQMARHDRPGHWHAGPGRDPV